MKTYKTTSEGQWVEIKGFESTDDHVEFMKSLDEMEGETQNEYYQLIKSQIEGEVELGKVEELNNLYTSIKPEGNDYRLLSMVLMDMDGTYIGILNCKVNGKHKQLRF